ncbi:MAG: divalent-cation tolerance protein CutA [Verrucomicrobiota bacterium]
MNAQTTGFLLVFTNFPNAEVAKEIGMALVENQLAACVNVLSEATSIYRWKDATEVEKEIPALIKTTEDQFPQLRDKLVELHPYDVPEVIATTIADGSDSYLDWVRENTNS